MPLTADPLTDANNAIAGIIEATPAPKRRGTLLIVDDEDGPRQSLRVIFKDEYDLLMAEDGPTAIDLAQKHEIDVAVLDIRMAGMSGIEVLERLKYVKPDIEAIMMTAFETTDTIRQALRLRACDYINKPFDLATMRSAVGQAMQRRRLESEIHSSAEKVQELLAELQNQRVEEQIAKTRGDIYASIIHDINGPLTVISGFVQVMNQRLNRTSRMELEDLEFIKNRLGIVTRQTTNCIEISRRYLQILRDKPGESAPRVSVNQLLHDLEQLVRVHPSLHENEFDITPFGEDVGVKVNGTDVIQILQNLAVNAFQCSPTAASRGDRRRSAARAAGFDDVQGRPERPAAERREHGQHRAAGEILGARQRPRHSGGSAAENFPALLHHQRPARRNRSGPQHRPAAHQGRQRRAARPHANRRRHDIHDLSARRESGEVKFSLRDFQKVVASAGSEPVTFSPANFHQSNLHQSNRASEHGLCRGTK